MNLCCRPTPSTSRHTPTDPVAARLDSSSTRSSQTLLAEWRRCQEKAATSADAPKLFRHARSVPHPGRIVPSSTPLPRWSSFARGTSLRARAPFACGRVQNGKPSWFCRPPARAKERTASSATQHLSFAANQCVFATVEPIWCTISNIWQINFKQTLENLFFFFHIRVVLILMKGFDTTDYVVFHCVASRCVVLHYKLALCSYW